MRAKNVGTGPAPGVVRGPAAAVRQPGEAPDQVRGGVAFGPPGEGILP